MNLRTTAAALALAVAVMTSCSSTGTQAGNCGRYLELTDQAAAVTPEEFERRIQPDQLGEFPADSVLHDYHQNLLEAYAAGDVERAARAGAQLQDGCLTYLDG